MPPCSTDSDTAACFADLGVQCGVDRPTPSSLEFQAALQRRVAAAGRLFLLVTGFENAQPIFRAELAAALRALVHRCPAELRVVLVGGQRLVEQSFGKGQLSFLSGARVMEWPHPSAADVMAWQASDFPDAHLSAEDAQQLAESLKLPLDSNINTISQALRRDERLRTVVIVDEVDAFVRAEPARQYETLQRFRALSEPGHVQFVMAGFWSLYEQAVLDYQSPLKNFGTVLTVGALEFEACVELATKPMDRLSIRWSDPALAESLVQRTGQRANLISIACNELINALGTTERVITDAHLRAALDCDDLRRALEGWGGLGATPRESQLDRIVVFATVDQDQFTLAELMLRLESEGLPLEPEAVRRSIMRLELAFVLSREGSTYRYQVPLQRELIQEQDPRESLRRELRGYGAYGRD